MPIITDIAPQKRRPYRFSVFVDGDFAFGLHGDEVARYGITVGDTLTNQRLAFLKDEVVFVNARDTALRYIAYRARSCAETRKRLAADDYSPDIIDRVMALMIKYHYVDDVQFARDYAASRLRNGRLGLRRVAQELKMKGVEAALIEEALRLAAEEDGGEVRPAREWLIRKRLDLRDPIQRKRGVEALLRRGFRYGVIKEAIAMIEDEEYEDDEVYEDDEEYEVNEVYEDDEECEVNDEYEDDEVYEVNEEYEDEESERDRKGN